MEQVDNIDLFLKNLNEKQKESVIYFDSPLLILAGAGSGKTRVLTYKIAYIIKYLHKSPYNIFAVTFTNKAAEEMKTRVEKLIDFSVKGMWIGTFHSMCVKLIKMFRREEKLEYNFTIYDSADSKSLIKKIIKEKEYENILNVRSVMRSISNLKNKMITPFEYENIIDNDIQHYIKNVYKEYENYLEKNNALDFDSILIEAVNILKNNEDFKRKMQTMFQYILVDEYQDTNYVQYVLLKELYNKNNHISVVGDDDQSIYGFRGAEIRNILDFEKDFINTKIVKLEQNYRSTKNILEVSSSVIANNSKRKQKKLWSDFENGKKVFLIEAMDENQEALFIAREIMRIKRKGNNFADCAILYRTNAQSRPFEEMLRKFLIPYTVIGGIKFFERKEIKDILAYLNVIVNHKDNISLFRIINIPRRGIGKKGISKINDLMKEKKIYAYDIIMNVENYKNYFSSITFNGLKNLKKVFTEIETYTDNAGIAVEKIIEISDYNNFLNLSNEIEAITRKENLQELINSANDFSVNSEENTLENYLDMISLYTDIDNYNETEDSVVIMTVHNAKGLEFKHVFIAGVEEGLFPHVNSFEKNDGIEEERRLFYVAMTRAKKTLHITYANSRNWFGNRNLAGKSSFIFELPDKYIEKHISRNGEIISKIRKERIITKYSNIENKNTKNEFSINDKIIHPYWGEGIVKNIRGNGESEIATIRFLSGEIKKIYVKYANLERKV